jgi:hypothetical protein
MKEQASIQLATTLDCIWQLRNQAAHSMKQVNNSTIKSLELRISEHIYYVNANEAEGLRIEIKWTTPQIAKQIICV